MRILLIALFLFSTQAIAGMTIGASWADQESHLGLEKLNSYIASGTISFDLLDHIQIGFTGRKEYEKRTGLKRQAASDGSKYIYYSFKDVSETITTSVDLTLVLYNGTISPFIFGGVARRQYRTSLQYGEPFEEFASESKSTLPTVPNGGFGLAIYMGRGFSLKFTQTYTEGQKITIEDGNRIESKVYDRYTQVGLNYRL